MDKIELTELANKLFMYTDYHRWVDLVNEVFIEDVWVDMSSAGGGEPKSMKAKDICAMRADGFAGLDSVHHQAGHYLINVNGEQADIFAYAVAYHLKNSATNGTTRSFVGSYDLKATKTANGWRLNQFKYNLKFIDGNATLA